ncbi:MAG: hypothetical protein V4726_21900 [Verrucomicrobiota bacterium]
MTPLENLSASDFTSLTGQILTLQTAAGEEHPLELTAVTPLGSRHPGASRDPFSLTFRGPSGLRLPQSIYPFQFPGAGRLEFFITQTADSWFEAVFT